MRMSDVPTSVLDLIESMASLMGVMLGRYRMCVGQKVDVEAAWSSLTLRATSLGLECVATRCGNGDVALDECRGIILVYARDGMP